MSCISAKLCEKKIFMDIEPDCENRLFSGIGQGSIIVNKTDIKSFTYDPMRKNLITNITLKEGAKAYRWIIDSKNPFATSNTTMNANDGTPNDWTNTLSGLVMTNGDNTTRLMEVLASGKFVVIIENEYEGDIEKDYYHYQIYGLDKGLVASNIVSTKYENNDAFTVELQEANTPNAGRFFLSKNNQTSEFTVNATEDSTTDTYTITVEDTSETMEVLYSEPVKLDDNKYMLSGVFNYEYSTPTDHSEKNYVSYVFEYVPSSTESIESFSFVGGSVVVHFTSSISGGSYVLSDESVWYDDTCEKLNAMLVG